MLLCKGGKPIDNVRIEKYEKMCHFLVRKFLPAMNLYEASMDYEDLVNQCRYEVLMALRNFDPKLAMQSFRVRKILDENGNPIILKTHKNGKIVYLTEPDEEFRKKEIKRKMSNPEVALRKAEESIVFGRLSNYLRRTRWKYNEINRGGKTVRMGLLSSGVDASLDALDLMIESMESNKSEDLDFYEAMG